MLSCITFSRSFNSQPPEGGWGDLKNKFLTFSVSTHSRPKAAGELQRFLQKFVPVSTHSRPKAAGQNLHPPTPPPTVSTHSRPKAAGWNRWPLPCVFKSFNSQPPEGGWSGQCADVALLRVSTHSRPKAAGLDITGCHRIFISFNSQPPEGGWRCAYKNILFFISFNSQPPEGGWAAAGNRLAVCRCFNSQPPEGGWVAQLIGAQTPWQFQLTAARRRLGDDGPANSVCGQVSTHSRPKAAGAAGRLRSFDDGGFNSQPPEGGWWLKQLACVVRWCFNSQPPERGWPRWRLQPCKRAWFQLTAARRRLGTR